MIRSVTVAGCSFSDYLANNQTVYGRELSLLIGSLYQHEGAGSGSNWRIWRRISSAVLEGRITAEDLVIIQYTGMERREFWSHHPHEPKPQWSVSREPYAEGSLIRYKNQSWTWMDHRDERDFMRLYEQRFLCWQYEQELFRIQHLQFQLLLREYRIPTVFLDARHTPLRPLPLIEPFTQWQFTEPLWFCERRDLDNIPGDQSHFSDQGHREFAQLLYDHLQSVGLA